MSQLAGKRDTAPIWRHGIELEYLEDNMKKSRLWLCERCHLGHVLNNVRRVDGTAFITKHMQKVHGIDPSTGYLPETPSRPAFNSPFEAAATAGSASVVSHSPWQEDALQSALVDWVIAKDVSFFNATSNMTRGLLTWNRSQLLAALPKSPSTMSSYVMKRCSERKVEVAAMLRASSSRISISIDVWTSSNYMSFLGVVAHFVGKSVLLPWHARNA
jgi:hypothetical protein